MKITFTTPVVAEIHKLLKQQALSRSLSVNISGLLERNVVLADDSCVHNEDLIVNTVRALGKMNNVFESDEQRDEVLRQVRTNARVFSTGKFHNDYISHIILDQRDLGPYLYGESYYKPFQVFPYNCAYWVKDNYYCIPRLACFDNEITFPLFAENNRVWMSITPNEIFTMEEPIERAHGKVLTLGCGMGYFAFMASQKESVESVTIVEFSSEVIDMFQELVLPQFPHSEKITVIRADAFSYLETLEDGTFDYCFADIWIGAEDLEKYLAMRCIGRRFQKTEIDYWMEESFLNYLTMLAALEVEDSLPRRLRRKVSPHSLASTLVQPKSFVTRLLRDVSIESVQDLRRVINPTGMLDLLCASPEVFSLNKSKDSKG